MQHTTTMHYNAHQRFTMLNTEVNEAKKEKCKHCNVSIVSTILGIRDVDKKYSCSSINNHNDVNCPIRF